MIIHVMREREPPTLGPALMSQRARLLKLFELASS